MRHWYGHRENELQAAAPPQTQNIRLPELSQQSLSGEAFSVIGRVPYGFTSYSKSATNKQNFGTFGKQITSSNFASRGATFTSQDFSKEEDYQTALDYQTGTKVFVDDEGYGIITKQFVKNEEIVVDVQFENGKVKKYLPKYQKNKLLVIKD